MASRMVQLLVFMWWTSAVAFGYSFRPDNHDNWKNNRIPSQINLSQDQNSGSYWSSAFVTTTTGRQFLLIHHQFNTFCKSSVLDLKTLKYLKNVQHCEINNASKTVLSDSLSIQFPDFSFDAAAPDKISQMQLSSTAPQYSFNLTVEGRTSKVLLNGGNGVIAWGPNYTTCSHWSIPAARTSGTLQLGAEKALDLDSSKSLTWYDHQIIKGPPDSFTFFEVHFPDPNIRVSIWAYDWPESSDEWRFATVRLGEETTMVLPFTLEEHWEDSWWSSTSNRTYPQSWTLTFDNGDYLRIRSVLGDQEIQPNTWTGFVKVERSRFLGQTTGYGVGDMVFI
ncbi:CrtC domain-containing protein [Fusarium falciforme]|uniref:CrtC domain-containing protein n=1 Tax=Fusarium falciforme TaxID=195108 RepID=UPI002301F27F|nr:CrtC domain-containing protein [Fusarium falciforme]WAO84651.1 CrtC domain-containing protein [Fusarium falciforme]